MIWNLRTVGLAVMGLLVASCGSGPHHVTDLGIQLNAYGSTPVKLVKDDAAQIDHFVEVTVHQADRIPMWEADALATLQRTPIWINIDRPIHPTLGDVAGIYWADLYIHIERRGNCYANSALVHEIAHALLWEANDDISHDRSDIFQYGGMISQINDAIGCDMYDSLTDREVIHNEVLDDCITAR